MAFLRFDLPVEEAWEVEKHARSIRDCDDPERLRVIAEQAFRAWCGQADITAQLIAQIAELEVQLAALGVIEEPDAQYLAWARELAPNVPGD
jgi:hypothetical protein